MEPLRSISDERRFQLLVDAVTDYAIYLIDPAGLVASWNSGAQRIKGYAASEIVGQHFSQFYTQEDRRRGAPQRALATARSKGQVEHEGWLLRKDGGRFWAQWSLETVYDEAGELIGFAQTTRDITERQAAQQALLESERQFRLLVDGVTDYALYMLDPNGVITNWNSGAQRIKGYTGDEVIGHHFSKFYTDVDRRAGIPAQALNRASNEGKYEAEGWRVRKDGTVFWASVLIDSIRDERGTLLGFAKITRDVTERRQTQLELQRTHEQLVQAQKMEALGQLTGGVAHDFNNLLMVVSGHADLLRRRTAQEQQQQLARSIDAISQAVQRGESLTRQLLAFARRQRLHPRSVSLTQHLDSFSQMLASSLHANITLEILVGPETWPVQVDPSELELALVNIAVNARDAMPEGGQLTLMAENRHLARGDVDPELEGDFVALTALDAGVGIPPDILSRVFDPFFSTKEAGKGTGLGLSQVYGFARQSGGAVTISSQVGQGAEITLYLPRATSEPEAILPGEAGEPPPQESRAGRVLLVEDNPDVAQVTAALLEQLGYAVRLESGAEGALRAVEAGSSFDLVFSDIVMAGPMDGLALARVLRDQHPSLPILLATGYTNAAEAVRDDFAILRKPYQIDELRRAIATEMSETEARAGQSNLVRFPGPGKRGPKPTAS